MACKKPVSLILYCCSETSTASGFYHPAKCMKARQSHLDVVSGSGTAYTFLLDVSKKRGVVLECTSLGDCIELTDLRQSLPGLRICVERGVLACTKRTVYVKYTGRGVYIGPVKAVIGREGG